MDYFKIRNLFTEHQKKHIMYKQYKNNFKLIYTAIYQIKRWDIEKKVLGTNSLSKFGSQNLLKIYHLVTLTRVFIYLKKYETYT